MSLDAKPQVANESENASVAKLDADEQMQGDSLWLDSWKRLRRNKAAVVGGVIILINLVVALLAPFLSPYTYQEQELSMNNAAPMWIINMFPVMKAADQNVTLQPVTDWEITIENGEPIERGDVLARRDNGETLTAIMEGTAFRDGANVGVTRAGIQFYEINEDWDVLLTNLDLMRPVDPGTVIARNGEQEITVQQRSNVDIGETSIRITEQTGGYVKVTDDYAIGTDHLGRDMLVRIMYGARISLAVAFVGPLVSFVVGLTVGLTSGYTGGWVDNLLMRFVDIMYAFPTLLLIILLMAFFRNSFNDANPGSFRFVMGQADAALGGMLFIFIGIGITSWMSLARLTRGQVLSVREQEYIEAARSIGTDRFTIIRTHVLPNILGPIVVAETLTIPVYISYEAFLSFIGLGVNPPTPSWGAMINDGAEAIATYPFQALFPALALFFVMFAFNFLGDGLRDALDPRMRGVD